MLMVISCIMSLVGLLCALAAWLYGLRQKQLNDELRLILEEYKKVLKNR